MSATHQPPATATTGGRLTVKDLITVGVFSAFYIVAFYVAGMLGMTSPEAERRMMEDALSHREERGAAAPPVWAGVAGGDDPKRAASGTGYTPEGF